MSQDLDPTGTPSTAPPHSPWERFGWVMGTIWLVFLFFPVVSVLTAPLPPAVIIAALSCIGAFAVIYVWGFVRLYRPTQESPAGPRTTVILLVLVALAIAVGALVGVGALGMVSYLVAYSMFSQPTRIAYGLAAVWLAVTIGLLVITGTFASLWFFVFIVLLVAVVTGIVRWIDDRQDQHLRTRQELDLVAERERVARDVHDVLGHSLTVITMKSQLAQRLVDADPQAAKSELAQIQSMTRESLAEIRATVAGLRVARLGDELVNAREALADAGIEADVPTDAEIVDPRHRLVLAWVVREAVTNVVRHSGATCCTVTLAPHGLVVADDGVGPGMAGSVAAAGADGSTDGTAGGDTNLPATEARPGIGAAGSTDEQRPTEPTTSPPEVRNGHGIRGARERVQAAGGSLTVTSPPEGGTRVEVHW